MNLTPSQKSIIERVINVFETGRPAGDYGSISIFHDGPNDIRQVTYGRSQTTEYGALRRLVALYVAAQGANSAALAPYVDRIGRVPLVDDSGFLTLLRSAGQDPVMHRTQDAFFDNAYFKPAERWADNEGFTDALSMLVIYDSFIHSGRIHDFLRARFAGKPPRHGGDERMWISRYVDTREEWLSNHPRKILRKTIYRTDCFQQEIARGNWNLDALPIMANGVAVRPAENLDANPTILIAEDDSGPVPHLVNV